jgi:hypothetical protein
MTPSGLSHLFRYDEHNDRHIVWPVFDMVQEVGVAGHTIAQSGSASKSGARAIVASAAINTPNRLRCIARVCGRDA